MKPPGETPPSGPRLESPYITMTEAAVYARCSRRTLERRIKAGAIPCYKIGRKTLIRLDDLEADLAAAAADCEPGGN